MTEAERKAFIEKFRGETGRDPTPNEVTGLEQLLASLETLQAHAAQLVSDSLAAKMHICTMLRASDAILQDQDRVEELMPSVRNGLQLLHETLENIYATWHEVAYGKASAATSTHGRTLN